MQNTQANKIPALDNELAMSAHARWLKKHGMYTAAIFYKNRNETVERRLSRVTRYILEQYPLPEFSNGQELAFPSSYILNAKLPEDDANGYGYHFTVNGYPSFRKEKFERLMGDYKDSVEQYIAESIHHDALSVCADPSRERYNHGGVHNVLDWDTIVNQGISGYRKRIEEKLASAEEPGMRLFEEGLLDVAIGLEGYINRYTEKLETVIAGSAQKDPALEKLLAGMKKVPLGPAESFYDAVLAVNTMMVIGNILEPGRIDQYLYPFYVKDKTEGRVTDEEAFRLIRMLLSDINDRIGHPGVTHVTIGGTKADGSPAYNELTEIVIRAIGGLRTPNVTLRVRRDMPQNLWDAFLNNISKGYGQPAIVNEEQFMEHLVKDYDLPFEEAAEYVFGGCSELLIQGKSMCDSTWVAYNMLDIFQETMYNHFLSCDTFESFYKRFKEECTITIKEMEEMINIRQFSYGLHFPEPITTLFVRDCIEDARSFTNGGARYNFDATNIYGATNAINSLYTLKYFYEGKLGECSKETLLRALIRNFEGFFDLHTRCKKVPKFGNHNTEINELAHDLMDHVFGEVMKLRCYRSSRTYTGRFMPAIILWTDWILCGERVGATPDGRLAGEATVDSCGPMQGTDTEGPTSVMNAALSLPQEKCIGTCVLNLRLDPAVMKTPEGKKKVQMLFTTYFGQGGNQLQINVLDPEMLQEALRNPENHQDIIVRVGGFSDNFVKLSPAIQQEVIKRTQHSL
ncbi:MAG: hypothetical protein E7335_06775 [Clostridiales bacterium]|nr:hypothetical protein [Clostridiales bacterium]